MAEAPDRLSDRLRSLSPEQRRLLALRARKDLPGVVLPEAPGEAGPSAGGESIGAAEPAAAAPSRARALDWSLFFFSDDGRREGEDKYRLLLDCARFADAHGFAALWTPERHFQDFGGLYPNPSVLSAALAMVTERLAIRAGSLVLPLHNPIRVAEDWALLDNLSHGRVGLSLATGWFPADFALAPEAYEDRRALLERGLGTIRRLWAGERLRLPGGDGREVEVSLLPRPVQPELPVWLTSSGSEATWARAGTLGTNVLSALHGDPREDLAPRIDLYRQKRAEAGLDPAAGRVTVMLHTFVGEDDEAVREQVRGPLTGYLRTFVEQGRRLDARALGVEPAALSDRDLDDLAASVFERFFTRRALLGDAAKCAALADLLAGLGVDEIACLVDFGLDARTVLDGLEPLARLIESRRVESRSRR